MQDGSTDDRREAYANKPEPGTDEYNRRTFNTIAVMVVCLIGLIWFAGFVTTGHMNPIHWF